LENLVYLLLAHSTKDLTHYQAKVLQKENEVQSFVRSLCSSRANTGKTFHTQLSIPTYGAAIGKMTVVVVSATQNIHSYLVKCGAIKAPSHVSMTI
jgi:hypothetical protein